MKEEFHPRTKELRAIMSKHSLSARQVGTLVGRSRQAVKRWTSELTLISTPLLDLLKYRLKDQKKGGAHGQ